MLIDFSPLITPVTNLAVAAVLAGWGVISHQLNLSNSSRDSLDLALTNAVHYAAGTLDAKLSHEMLNDVKVRSGLLALGARYLVNTVPDAIARFHLDDPTIDAKLLARAAEIVHNAGVVTDKPTKPVAPEPAADTPKGE